MQKRRISADGLSNVLAAGVIGLFAAGHLLPVFIEGDSTYFAELSGGEIAIAVPRIFYRLWAQVWTDPLHALWSHDVLAVLFLPIIWGGVGGFFLARSHPRIAGLIALFSGLCAAASLGSFWRLEANNPMVSCASGFYVWFSSIGLLCAAGLCKLMSVRKQPAT
jgi:hypothetical protein